MNSKPLSYDSLKIVLKHTDANTRINLSARVPSIRKTEKSVPLHIKYLYFDYDSISIDNSNYKVGVFRDYGVMKTPNYVKRCNEQCDRSYDIDEYGFEDLNSLKQRLLPEDIVMEPRAIEEPPPRNDDTMRQKEAYIVFMKSQISELDNTYKDFLNEQGFETIKELAEQLHSAREQNDEIRYQTLYNVLENLRSANYSLMLNVDEIYKVEHYLECYNYFQNKTSPPYKPFIQLTVSQSRNDDERDFEYEAEQIERVEYRKQLPLALRAISNFIFGGRRHPVHIKKLHVEDSNVIRVPCDLHNWFNAWIFLARWKLSELKIKDFAMVFGGHAIDIKYFQCEIFRNAKKVIIEYHDNNALWLPILLALQNRIVFMNQCFSMSVNDYVDLIRTWAVQGKELGTVFTFKLSGLFADSKTEEIVDRVVEELEGAEKNDRFVNVPMPNRSSRIYVTTWEVFDCELELFFFLEIKVVSSRDDLNQ